MRRVTQVIVFLTCLIIHILPAHAETWFNLKHLNTSDGLSQPGILCVASDSTNCIWIGTKFGLNSFKNNEIYNYIDSGKDKTVIKGTYISGLHLDKKGRLWVNTEAGVSIYDRESDSFKVLLSHSCPIIEEWDGTLCCGGSEGIFCFNEDSQTFEEMKNSVQGHDLSKLIPISKDELLIVCRYHRPYLYSKSKKSLRTFLKDEANPDDAIYLTAERWRDRIFISVYHKGIFSTDLEGRTIHRFTQEDGLSSSLTLDMLPYYNELWLATDEDGILCLDPFTNKVVSLNSRREMGGQKLPTNSFTSLYKDCEGNVWAGSVKYGVIAIRETSIRSYQATYFGMDNGLSANQVQSIYEENDDRTVWIGTDGEGVNRFDIQTGKFKHYPEMKKMKITSLTEFDRDCLICSVYGKGLYLFEKQSGHIRKFTLKDPQTDREEFSSGVPTNVYNIDGDIFFMGSRMYVYDTKSHTYIDYKNLDKSKTKGLSIIYLSEDICYAIGRGGLFEISREGRTIRNIYSKSGIDATAADYNDGKIWFVKSGKLANLSIKTGEVQFLENQMFRRITRLQFDNAGRLWITADNKLFCYTESTGRFEIFDESDGFPHNEINAISTLDDSRYMIMGGPSGLVVAPKALAQKVNRQPRVTLVEAVVNGERMSCVNLKKLKVAENYSTFDIHIALDSYELFTQRLFKFQFNGKINGEITTYRNIATIPPLPDGNYTITASYLQKDGSWSTPSEILKLKITPPLYTNPWFIFLLMVLGGCLAYNLYLQHRARSDERIEQRLLKQKELDNEQMIQFLVNVSHEIRTPLTLIHAPLKRLLEKTDDMDQRVATSLKGIYKHVHNMVDLINMVLDINRINNSGNALRKMPTEIGAWAMEIINEFKTEYNEKHIEIVFDSDCENLRVWFDKWKCRIVLSNLLMNALKFSPEHTKVIVSIHKTSKDIVRIAVKDQGPGLDKETQTKLFSRFAQGQLNAQGTGLGLAYSYKLINLHGGTMGAFNNETEGSTFYFDLPLMENAPAKPAQPQAFYEESVTANEFKEGDINLKTVTVLVVDDNKDLTDFLQESLSDQFKKVQVASNGVEALEKLRGPEVADLVISDVMMPEMDGFALCTAIKNDINISHIPVILLTAKTEGESVLTAYKIGADSYIPKPFDNDFLIVVARNLLLNREKARVNLNKSADNTGAVENTFASVDEQFILKFNNIIQENLDSSELDVEFLAQSMLMSRSSLYNKVKALTGLGVNEYVNQTKMKIASEMVKTTNLPITEIAYRLGYSSHHYFSKCFKTYFGTTPSEMRKQFLDKP